jgi:hypothetical protein
MIKKGGGEEFGGGELASRVRKVKKQSRKKVSKRKGGEINLAAPCIIERVESI